MTKTIDIRNLSNLEVLKVCKELWVWISEHPDREKYNWPGWRKYTYDINECPCCAKVGYKAGTTIPNCINCPLKKQFQRGKILSKSQTIFYCENYSASPWEHYRSVYLEAWKKRWALKMVKIIDEAITELEEKENA